MPKSKKKVETKEEKAAPKPIKKIILLSLAGVLACLVVFCIIGAFFLNNKYNNKVYPNIFIGNLNLGGKTHLEAMEAIEASKKSFDNEGLKFKYLENEKVIPTTYIKDEVSGLSVDILYIDSKATADNAYNYGKSSFWQKIKLFFSRQQAKVSYTLNSDELTSALNDQFSLFENPAEDAKLSFVDGAAIVSEEKTGTAFNWVKVIGETKNNISALDNKTISINLEADEPDLKKSDTTKLVQEAEELLLKSPLILKHEDKTWEFSKTDLEPWLAFAEKGLVLNKTNVETSLKTIAAEIDEPVQEGKFSIKTNDDKTVSIEQFQEGHDGLELQIADTINKIQLDWIDNEKNNVEIVMAVTQPKVTPGNIADLGIKELLGTGHTNFGGSPSNRIKNITKGVNMLNGLLIAPDETFSLVKALGHIDGEHGWLPELVIKENKTIPEFGGGLCQIGTTTFRAAMMSGLEIVERRNHSYVVSYYNYKGKPGVDATIYEPQPDMKFKNNTGHYILWNGYISGADIYFEFWGTSDGRNGYFTDPVNYNAVSAPEPIITEVDDLAPGEMVCSEKSHNGISASFDYIIERADGTKTTETFTSVYKALPSICKKGKEDEVIITPTTNTNANKNTNTSTNKNSNKNKNTNKKNKNSL